MGVQQSTSTVGIMAKNLTPEQILLAIQTLRAQGSISNQNVVRDKVLQDKMRALLPKIKAAQMEIRDVETLRRLEAEEDVEIARKLLIMEKVLNDTK